MVTKRVRRPRRAAALAAALVPVVFVVAFAGNLAVAGAAAAAARAENLPGGRTGAWRRLAAAAMTVADRVVDTVSNVGAGGTGVGADGLVPLA